MLTAEQIDLARHALGLPNRSRQSYRNRYCIGVGGDGHAAWMQMVEAGAAWRRAGSQLTGGDDLFGLTEVGALAALKRGERLCTEDFPPARIALQEADKC